MGTLGRFVSWLLPSRRFALESPLAFEPALSRLRRAVELRRQLWRFSFDHLPFQGHVSDPEFSINRVHPLQRHASVRLSGVVTATSTGTRIEGHAELTTAAKIGMGISLVVVALVTTAMVVAGFRESSQLSNLGPLAVVAFALFMTRVSFAIDAHLGIGRLARVLDGRRVPVR